MDIHIGIPKRVGHLPLVMDVFRRSGMARILDEATGQDPRSEVSTSECVGVILCGVYCGAHSLWRLRERLEPYDLKTVMQDPTFDLDRFPEERLAKALDDLFSANLDHLMSAIALPLIRTFLIDLSFLHFDTTTLSMYGAYEGGDPWGGLDGMPPPPRVVFGHSKANRPDLKQILYGMLVSNDGGIPLLGKALDGNASDALAAADFFARVRELVEDPKRVCCVCDCKGWCSTVLQVVEHTGMRLLSRLPRNHRLHRDVMGQPFAPDGRLELTPRKTSKGDPDVYTYQGLDVTEVLMLEDDAEDGTRQRRRLEVPARALRVHSTALLRTKTSTRSRLKDRERKDAQASIRAWHDEAFKCRADAERAAERRRTQSEWVTLDLHADVVQVTGPTRRGRGRPRKHPEPVLEASEHWRVSYSVSEVDEGESHRRLHDQATFVLIRTRNKGWDISDEEMILRYKDQFHVEHGFSWLKTTAAINPMFLHTPKRIASLCFIYCLGLMMWNLIQRTVRGYLQRHGLGLPYHRRKLSDRITTRFLFELFPMVQTVPMTAAGRTTWKLVGLEQWQQLAARALGTSERAFAPVV